MPGAPTKHTGYLPSLDGWRAIAILAVLFVHELPLTVAGHSIERWQRFGSLGVTLFFSISGLLIVGRILEEETLTRRFHVKQFYIRRFFRIQPCMWAYLAVIAALVLGGVLREAWSHWLGALFLYENFLYREAYWNEMMGYFTGHFWTLAVEEHFYILISMLLFFFKQRRWLVIGCALLLVKIGQHIAGHYTPDELVRRTYWNIHLLLLPAWFAALLRVEWIRSIADKWLRPGLIFGLTALLTALVYRHPDESLRKVLAYSFTFWVASTMLHPASWTTRILEWTPLRFLGRLSYSIYVWHVLFYSAIAKPPIHSHLLLFLAERPWKYIATLAAALLSYYFIEKPMIRLGHRLAPPATAGRGDLRREPTMPHRE